MTSVISLRLVACLVLATAPGFAQTRKAATVAPSGPHKLLAVEATGSHRFKTADIVAATGLRVGDIASDDDFSRATRDLSSTGLFANVSYTYHASSAGTRLDIALVDGGPLVPAHFENIVWFSDDALLAELHKRVPLFKEGIPVGGNLADQISDAIQALLLENKAPGHVDYAKSGPEGGPVESFDYAVDNVTLVIGNITISGGAPADQAALAAKSANLTGRPYARDALLKFANAQLLPYYLSRGYLKAAFAPPQPKAQAPNEDEVPVDITLPVEPGRIYTFAGATWSGNKALKSDRLEPLIHLQPGQPSNSVQLDSDLAAASLLYGTRGYVRAEVKPIPHFDDAKGTVTYDLAVQEGDLFKMGELQIRGLDSHTTAQLEEKWAIQTGAPYDSSYPKKFREEAWKLLATQVEWTVDMHEAIDDREKVVDVSLMYSVRSRQ
jgi:outer membrane protein insertion porin family